MNTSAVAAADMTEQPRMNRRQIAKVRTRKRVLDAARDLFADRGYDSATIRDIARGAGMSTGAVFANFQDKAELFQAVLMQDMTAMAQTLAAGAGEGTAEERLSGALKAGYHQTLEHLPLIQAIVARSWFQPHEAEARSRAAIRPLVQVVSDILKDGVSKGDIKQDADIGLLTELIWDAYLSNFRRAAYDGWTSRELGDHIDRQLDVILTGARTA